MTFISHSSRHYDEAMAFRDWLIVQDFSEIILDFNVVSQALVYAQSAIAAIPLVVNLT